MTISCRKKNDNPVNPDNQVEIKKYAWAVGTHDSTGYGTILFSSDYGDNWERQGLGSLALQGIDITDIWAIDEKNRKMFIVSNERFTILKSFAPKN